LINPSTGALTLGGDALYGQYFAGRIDEVRVYNRALSVTEIQADMNTPVGENPPSLAPTISDIPDQVTTVNTPSPAIPFTVNDADTPVSNLTLSAGSTNPTLVPTNNVVFGGSESNRTVTVTPAANQTGVATITVTVSDGTNSASDSFAVTVNAVNTPPTITGIADQTINEDTSTAALGFTVGDAETAPDSLTLSKGTSNPALVPTNNIAFGGSGANRTVTVSPASNQYGTATITVSVSDGQLSTNTSFTLTVNAVNDPPTITGIANQAITVNTSTGPLNFTIGDVDTPVGNLTLSNSSSDPVLVPTGNIVLSGSGSNRTVTVTPATDQTGSATITVSVSDGQTSTSTSFVVTVSTSFTGTKAHTNATAIRIPSVRAATPYPSTISVAGMSGTLSNVTMTLYGITHQRMRDIDILLVGPGGQKVIVMSDVGPNGAVNNVTLTLSDAAASSLGTGTIVSGTYKPTNITTGDTFAAPAPAGPYGTTMSVFNATAANGTWSLYVVDDSSGSTGSIAGGWSLTVTTVTVPPTITAIADQTITVDGTTGPLSFTVGDLDTPLTGLTLTAGSSNPALVPTNNIAFGGSGSNRAVTVTPVAGQMGTTTITVSVSDGQFTTSTDFVLTVSSLLTGTKSFTNSAAIVIPDSGAGAPYPSLINVSGMGGTITNVVLRLNGFSHTWGNDVDVLLVGPGGQTMRVMENAGTGPTVNANLTFSNSAAAALPQTGALASGTYRPTAYSPATIYPSPAPAGPHGTNFTVFNGQSANGNWSLYVFDDGPGDLGSFASGWSVTISTAGAGASFLSAKAFVPVESAPRITSMTVENQGTVRLIVSGQAGFTYALEVSSDMIKWTKVAWNDNTSGTVVFTDPITTDSIRFYRAVALPK
ncbi:MAG: hypothetical protein HY298_19830, partial [Verrucomicrobia bacterium]|nr:hypothetical protein [Verrucomicrobiota bacterium]